MLHNTYTRCLEGIHVASIEEQNKLTTNPRSGVDEQETQNHFLSSNCEVI